MKTADRWIFSINGIAWLFTIGFCGLSFWQGCWAFVVWPYYLGCTVLELSAR